MKDSYVRATMFGNTAKIMGDPTKCRVSTFIFPASGNEGDFSREISYPSADGLILYLIKRIEKLEKQLEAKKK